MLCASVLDGWPAWCVYTGCTSLTYLVCCFALRSHIYVRPSHALCVRFFTRGWVRQAWSPLFILNLASAPRTAASAALRLIATCSMGSGWKYAVRLCLGFSMRRHLPSLILQMRWRCRSINFVNPPRLEQISLPHPSPSVYFALPSRSMSLVAVCSCTSALQPTVSQTKVYDRAVASAATPPGAWPCLCLFPWLWALASADLASVCSSHLGIAWEQRFLEVW